MEHYNKNLYLDLMIKCLINTIYEDPPNDPWTNNTFNLRNRINGLDWPSKAHTMIGANRLKNIQKLTEIIIKDNIPGDFLEAGVWRGGATIFMRAILKAYNITDKNVWVVDSFEGLPKPDINNFPADKEDKHYTYNQLAISLDQVKDNFRKYDLLDDQVQFLKGWFKDTLPNAPITQLSLLRLDGDMYESTINCLDLLYPKLSPGGFVIFDDANAIPACKKAILDYRNKHSIINTMYPTPDDVGGIGLFWRK